MVGDYGPGGQRGRQLRGNLYTCVQSGIVLRGQRIVIAVSGLRCAWPWRERAMDRSALSRDTWADGRG